MKKLWLNPFFYIMIFQLVAAPLYVYLKSGFNVYEIMFRNGLQSSWVHILIFLANALGLFVIMRLSSKGSS